MEEKLIKGAEEIIKKLLELLKIDAETEISMEMDEEDSQFLRVAITGNELGTLIGFRGNTLNALQTIFSQMLSRKVGEIVPVLVDVNDFRKRRTEYLKSLGLQAVQEARESKQDVELPHLSAYERRVIHLALKEEKGVKTESRGEGDERRIVVKIDVKD